MSSVKVLLIGDCLGGFEALFKKVATVNKKNGPFDLVLCVGQFFEESSDDGDIPEQLKPYVEGTAQLPVKTFFLGGYGKGSAATLEALESPVDGGASRSLYYLGRSGVTQLEALNIAFLDGTYSHRAYQAKPPPPNLPPPPSPKPAAAEGNGTTTAVEHAEHAEAGTDAETADEAPAEADADAAADGSTPQQQSPAASPAPDGAAADPAGAGEASHAVAARAKQKQAQVAAAAAKQAAMAAAAAKVCRHYNQSDVARLRHQLTNLPGEVDLLLTCEWPTGILQQLPAGQENVPGYQQRYTSGVVAELAILARPRYHVAGGQSVFYARPPYASPDLGAGPRATRFVGLGSVVPRRRQLQDEATAAALAVAAADAGSSQIVSLSGAGATAAGGGKGRAGIGHMSDQQQAAMASAAAASAAAATAAAAAATAAAVAATKQQKFLHALALVPASSMSIEQLGTLPDGCGEYPYQQQQPQVGQKRASGATYEHDSVGEHCSWRWLPPKRMRGGFGGGQGSGGPPFQPWGKPGVVKDSARSVFVRNLPFEATYEDLAAFFSQAGQVEDIRRGAQPDTGRPQPWCHVQFTDYGAVPAACALNGSRFMGRELTVATSTPLNKEGGPAGGHVLGDWRVEDDGAGGGYRGQHQQQFQQRQHGQQRGRGHRGGQQRDRQQFQQPEPEPGKPVEGCWFCLSSDQVDVDLVSSVGDEVYLALDKGPITPQHALIIPIEHYPSWGALPPAAATEISRYLSALRSAAASAGKQLVGFERHLKLRSKGGNHTHINTLPISKTAAEGAADVFKQMASEAGLNLVPVPQVDGQLDIAILKQVVGDAEYFLGLLPDGSGLVAALNPGQRAPIQLGRQILAQLADVPERADWKACTYSGDEEKAAADAFREYFKPYDIMQTE